MKKILVIAPHPDDETIGCGGTLLRHKDDRDEISCAIMTKLKTNKDDDEMFVDLMRKAHATPPKIK